MFKESDDGASEHESSDTGANTTAAGDESSDNDDMDDADEDSDSASDAEPTHPAWTNLVHTGEGRREPQDPESRCATGPPCCHPAHGARLGIRPSVPRTRRWQGNVPL